MVALDSLQMHLSALFHNSTGHLSIVTDNAIAPTNIRSRNLPQRSKSFGRSSQRRSPPRPTKRLPRRAKSAPEEGTSVGCIDDNNVPSEELISPPFSRWSSDPLMDSLSSLSSMDFSSLDRSSLDRSFTDEPHPSAFTRRTEGLTRRPPPRRPPSRSSSNDIADNSRSALPPQLPVRKVGDAEWSWNALPPQKPVRKQNRSFDEKANITSIPQSA